MGIELSVAGMKLFKLSALSILFLCIVCDNAVGVSGTGMGLYTSTEVPRMADVNTPTQTGSKLDDRFAVYSEFFLHVLQHRQQIADSRAGSYTEETGRGTQVHPLFCTVVSHACDRRSVSYSSMPISGEGKVYQPMHGSMPKSSTNQDVTVGAQDRTSVDDMSLTSRGIHKSDSKLSLREGR
eukprot:767414-Hanusia_phi.AAC.1